MKTFTLNIPISKVDEEQRIVTGIATTEALDSQGDIVDYEASKRAFSEWVGNIREMHGPVAIGKAVDVQFDDANKAVIVSAKISESADGENAWIKVKEGILTGFSIGGKIFKVAKDKAVEGANRVIEYALSETSLVDNPANPEARLLMVKSADGGLDRVEELTSKEVKKSIWDAQEALNAASTLAFLIMMESEEGEADQMSDLVTAFNALRDFAAKEIAEGDDYALEYANVMELANKAINLRKETMSKKELEKTNVVAGEERNEVAEVVTTQEEAGRPVNDTEERAAESGVPVDTGEEITVKTEGEADAEEESEEESEEEAAAEAEDTDKSVEEKVAEDAEEEKSDVATDLVKNVESLLAKLGDKSAEEMKKVADEISALSAKVEKFSSLEERLKKLEDQPAALKSKASYLVEKAESEEKSDINELLKRQEEITANPMAAKPGEAFEIYQKLRQANAK